MKSIAFGVACIFTLYAHTSPLGFFSARTGIALRMNSSNALAASRHAPTVNAVYAGFLFGFFIHSTSCLYSKAERLVLGNVESAIVNPLEGVA